MDQHRKDVESHTNRSDPHEHNKRSERGDEQIERLMRNVDPPGREPSDDELIDPGRNSPDRGPADNRS